MKYKKRLKVIQNKLINLDLTNFSEKVKGNPIEDVLLLIHHNLLEEAIEYLKQNQNLLTLETHKELFSALTHPKDYSHQEIENLVSFISKNFPRNEGIAKELMKIQRDLYIRK